MQSFINPVNFNIPKLGLGTYNLNGGNCKEMVKEAISLGYRHIDTAQNYDNEKEIGHALQSSCVSRNEFFITTKIGIKEFSAQKFIPAVQQSLRRLSVDYIDLLLLHWPGSEEKNKIALDQLSCCLEKGLCRNIGVSNFPLKEITMAREMAPIICNQVEYHPYLKQDNMLSYLKQTGLWLLAFSPLAMGKIISNSLIQEIAEEYNRKPVQIVLRWLVQQEKVAAIPKASTAAHLRENFDVFNFKLTGEDAAKISSLHRNLRLVDPAWAPAWDKN